MKRDTSRKWLRLVRPGLTIRQSTARLWVWYHHGWPPIAAMRVTVVEGDLGT